MTRLKTSQPFDSTIITQITNLRLSQVSTVLLYSVYYITFYDLCIKAYLFSPVDCNNHMIFIYYYKS